MDYLRFEKIVSFCFLLKKGFCRVQNSKDLENPKKDYGKKLKIFSNRKTRYL